MDHHLRDLERAARDQPTDEQARARYLLALVRLGTLESAWRACRERGDAVLANAIFELGQAPFTLEVVAWPHPHHVLQPLARILGSRSGEPQPAFIGRRLDADLRITSPWVPGRNCRITYAGSSRFLLEDLAGANGTWRDGARITSCQLGDRDRFSPSNVQIVIELRLGWDDVGWPAPPAALVDRLVGRSASDGRNVRVPD